MNNSKNELGVTLDAGLYVPVTNDDGTTDFYEYGQQASFIFSASPYQMIKGLDKLYRDYRNMNIRILDGMDVVSKDISGESPEIIDWWTRYYRAPSEKRASMWESYPRE